MRYFIVFYIGSCSTGRVTGQINFTANGNFLNRKKSITQIEEYNRGLKIKNVIITNIIELGHEDYLQWIED